MTRCSCRLPLLFQAALAAFLAFAPTLRAQQDPATEPTVKAVGKTMPAVVNINTERIMRRPSRDPFDALFDQFFGGPVERPMQRQKVQSLGSGFIVDPAGLIVTNEHVVERAENLKISVTLQNGDTYTARYVTGSADADLAMIKIEAPQPLPFISLSDISGNFLGQTVLVLGNPLGYGSSVARGILSAKNRAISVNGTEYQNLLQTDAAINPGNSGGPLIDLQGKLVGVASVKMAFTPQGVPTQGLAFAIPNDVVRDQVDAFRRTIQTQNGGPKPGQKIPGRPANAAGSQASSALARKFFGLQLQDLTDTLSDAFGIGTATGVLVADVEPNSPAAEAGLERGLVIAQVGRYQVRSVQQVEQLLEPISSGSIVDFAVRVAQPSTRGSGGSAQAQQVTLTAR